MATHARPRKPAYSDGFALCMPSGILLGKTYRDTPEAAIATIFSDPVLRDEFWQRAQAHGWTVRYVFQHVWEPLFFPTRQEVSE